MKTIIITGSDNGYAGLLFELLASLKPFKEKLKFDIGILDLGLSQNSLDYIKTITNHIATPIWDIPVRNSIKENFPYLRALTARPFLKNYFPDYDIYIWLDADTWVQDGFAIDKLIKAAQPGCMGLALQQHKSYVHLNSTLEWRKNRLLSYYPDGDIKPVLNNYYNAGVFSINSSAPHWASWEKYLKIGLRNDPETICDQTALNYAISMDKLRINQLPPACNWCCHLSIPILNAAKMKLCEPTLPHGEIGIIHLTANTHKFLFKINYANKLIDVGLNFNSINNLEKNLISQD